MDAGPSTSQSPATTVDAGPLPVKCGEIGFDPASATVANAQASSANNEQVIVLPERHPADRDSPHPPSAAPTAHAQTGPTTPVLSGSKSGAAKHTIYGFQTTQVIILGVFSATIIGTIVTWAILGSLISRNKIPALTGYVAVVVHVLFAIFVLLQIAFFERRLYYTRAERLSRLHRDPLYPTGDYVCPSTLAPWARPPLPTYAATLAQSGIGTGDVEDHIIAAPPPPAYGNTRGSTLLLSGFLTEDMRGQRPISAISRESSRSRVSRHERPLSYRSHDEQWEEYCDAQRARTLEGTLATLERPATALTRTH